MEQQIYESTITLQTDIYPLEAVYLACYSLIEQVYFHIKPVDGAAKIKVVEVALKRKEKSGGSTLGKGEREFLNELISQSLRLRTLKRNRKIRTQIIGSSLATARVVPDSLG
jgi:His-Xaa-Ser system protein HxsD